MKPLEKIMEAARARPRHIVLAEGEDRRVAEAACRAARDGLAQITLVGGREIVERHLAELGAPARLVDVDDPASSPRTPSYAAAYHDLRSGKGIDRAAAREAVTTPLGYAAMMVRQGDADGTIGGAVATTADTVRTALQIIGRGPDAKLVSSFFLMMLCEPYHMKKGAFSFADCGMVVDPDAEELAHIAVTSARSYETLTGTPARVAMLSFSTNGSATHTRVAKVAQSVLIARQLAPHLTIEGELQFDAAFVESVSLTKAPDSALGGTANVFIFPNLDAANIGYKIAQRIGGATAIGPILQGLARPANDLSRGCTVDDVYHMIALTSVQAAGSA